MPKRNALTDEQIERRRSIDRTAQRNARAKTKARIRELEKLVDSLQTSQGDERLQNVMNMLESQQDETRKLKGTLDAVRKLIGGEVTLPDDPQLEVGSEQDESKSIVRPSSIASPLDGVMTVAAPRSQEPGSSSPSSFSLPDRTRQQNPGFPRKLPTWQAVNNALEKAVIALQQQENRISAANDTDIAIRAVLDGWTAARTMRSLDLGWLILKQVDQHVFCDCSPATRIAILRAMRLNMLVGSYWGNKKYRLT
jgi:type II secretory pathway pseudopilin PulG